MRRNRCSISDYKKPRPIRRHGREGEQIILASICTRDEKKMRPIEQLLEGGRSLEAHEASRLLTHEPETQDRFIEDLEDALATENYSRVAEMMGSLESPTNRYSSTSEQKVVEVRVHRSSHASDK